MQSAKSRSRLERGTLQKFERNGRKIIKSCRKRAVTLKKCADGKQL
jgi:hypothetical protein